MKPRNSTPFRSHTSLAAAFSVALFSHFAAPSAFATIYYWDNDGTTAGFGTASGTWNSAGSILWNNDSTGGSAGSPNTLGTSITTTTGDALNFGNGATGLATGTVTVSGTVSANSVTFASGSGAITLSGSSISLGGTSPSLSAQNTGNIIGSNLSFDGNGTISFSRPSGVAGTLTINGQISGSGTMTFTTPNVNSANFTQAVVLGATTNYPGNTTITTANSGTTTLIRAGVIDALPTGTVLTLDGGNGPTSATRTVTFDVNSKNQTLAGLSNVTGRTNRNQRIANTGNTAATLTINNTSPASSTFSGNINGTALSLAKTGTGTQTLGAVNGYTGTTTISGGKLQGVVGGNCASSKVIIDNALATFAVSVTDNTKTWTCKELAPTAAGMIEFNFGAITPSTSISPLTINVPTLLTGLADFTAAIPKVKVNVDAGLAEGTYPLMTWDTKSGTPPSTADLTVSTLLAQTVPSLVVSGNTLNLVITSTAVSVVKENNTIDLFNGTSWVGGSALAVNEIAKWNSTVTSANTTNLGADLTWAGITIDNPNGPVTINAGNTLTLGAAAIDINLSTTPVTPADLTLNCPLTLGDTNDWNVATTRTLTLGGQVSGSFGFTKLGDGTAILSSPANSYTGNTTVSAGTLKLGASNVIPDGASKGNVSVAGTLNLNGKSDTVNGLSGAGVIDNLLTSTTSTLNVGSNNQTSTFDGVIQSTTGNVNLVKTGNGTLTLNGANTFTGTVAITASTGSLVAGNVAPFNNVTGISMGGGTTLRPQVTGTTILATTPITLGAAATTSTITAPLLPSNSTGATTPKTFDVQGAISGDGNLTLLGVNPYNQYGTVILSAQSSYTGSTLITCSDALTPIGNEGNQNIFVRLSIDDALPATTVLTLDGGDGAPGASAPGRYCELDLNGNNQTLAGLTNVAGRNLRVQRVVNNSATAATLTVNNSVDHTYSGQLGWVSGFGSTAYNNLNLTKSGGGVQTLSGALKYSGNTTVNGGTLKLGNTNANNDLSTVTIAASGAFLELAYAGTDTVDKLYIGGTQLAAGVYGPSATNISQITGTGTLTVTTGPLGFSSWITGTFAGGATVPLDKRGANDDFDNDGISNLVEYAIAGQDPTVTNASISTFTANVLSFTKRAGTSGLTYAIQESTDLGIGDDWTEVTGGSYVNDATTISYTLTPGTPARNFLRLQAMSN